MMRSLLLLLAALSFPLAGRDEIQCPWINAATVAGSPDIPVRLEMQTTHDGGSCLFRYQEGATSYRLSIAVHNSQDAGLFTQLESQCASKATPLSGVGNEALLCMVKPHFPYAVQVVGRVRNRVFVVDVSANAAKDDPATRGALRDKADLAAEQVAGNLF